MEPVGYSERTWRLKFIIGVGYQWFYENNELRFDEIFTTPEEAMDFVDKLYGKHRLTVTYNAAPN